MADMEADAALRICVHAPAEALAERGGAHAGLSPREERFAREKRAPSSSLEEGAATYFSLTAPTFNQSSYATDCENSLTGEFQNYKDALDVVRELLRYDSQAIAKLRQNATILQLNYTRSDHNFHRPVPRLCCRALV